MVNEMQSRVHITRREKKKNPVSHLQGLAGVTGPVNINQYAAELTNLLLGWQDWQVILYEII